VTTSHPRRSATVRRSRNLRILVNRAEPLLALDGSARHPFRDSNFDKASTWPKRREDATRAANVLVRFRTKQRTKESSADREAQSIPSQGLACIADSLRVQLRSWPPGRSTRL
jgi:hypothetical protein